MANLLGTEGNDTLIGTQEAENISALAGNDTVLGLGGFDWIEGNLGNDNIWGSASKTAIYFLLKPVRFLISVIRAIILPESLWECFWAAATCDIEAAAHKAAFCGSTFLLCCQTTNSPLDG